MSCLNALRAYSPENPLVRDISQQLSELDRVGKRITLCWIPSHVGIAGNEAADAAARRAAKQPCLRRFPLPAEDLFPVALRSLANRWQGAWSRSHSHSKLFEIKPKLAPWPSSFRKNRQEEVMLCRLRTGHTYASHGYLLSGAGRPAYSRCGCQLSVKHVLIECPHLAAERLRRLVATTSLTLKALLNDDSSYINTDSLFTFIRESDFAVIYRFR